MRLLGYEVICKSRKQRETLVLESAPFSFFATNIVSSMLFCKFLQSFLLLRKSKEIIVR